MRLTVRQGYDCCIGQQNHTLKIQINLKFPRNPISNSGFFISLLKNIDKANTSLQTSSQHRNTHFKYSRYIQ